MIQTPQNSHITFNELMETLIDKLGIISEVHQPEGKSNTCFANQLKLILSLIESTPKDGEKLIVGLEYSLLKNSPLYLLVYKDDRIQIIPTVKQTEIYGEKREKEIIDTLNSLEKGIIIVGEEHIDAVAKSKPQAHIIYDNPIKHYEFIQEKGIYKSKQDHFLIRGFL
ncbi:MAG: hypothetical protein PHD81_01980 [Candidatus Nanoarchaeia archaeon]|nr:hypothetical protein [Candidatus Nanoarchaeia archaeon]MDD5587858.1 hypothetical protein [Candidatus Nanoarchaeia archaeon]